MHMFGNKKVCVIAAVSRNGVYGRKGKIPWKIPEEQQFFKETTMGHTVVMGRKTWESLPLNFRPLPGRENIVLTQNAAFQASGAKIAVSLENAIRTAENETIFVIGGKEFWFTAMSFVHEAWITTVHTECRIDPSAAVAPALVRPIEHWPDLALHETKKYPAIDNAPAFDINHWVRM